METKKEKKTINPWGERTIITLSAKNYKKLMKKGRCNTVVNYQWYTIKKEPELQVYDANGNIISLKALRNLLKNGD